MIGADVGAGPDGTAPRRSRPRNWALAATIAVLLALFYVLHNALLPFIIAAVIAFVLDPVIETLRRRMRTARLVPALLLYLLLLIAAAGFARWLWAVATAEFAAAARDGPRMFGSLLQQMMGPDGIALFGTTYTPQSVLSLLQQQLAGLLGGAAAGFAAELGIGVVLGGFLTLVLIPYMLVSGRRIADGLIWLVPPERRGSVHRLLPKLVPVIRRYIVGVMVVVAFTATAAWLGFGLIFRLPHAVPLSLAVGALEMIPALGPASSMALVALVSTGQHSAIGFALLMGYAILLRLVIDNAIGPVVLGQAARLHPVAIMFAFVCGAAFLGAVGLLIAVPTAACIVVVLENYYGEQLAESERTGSGSG